MERKTQIVRKSFLSRLGDQEPRGVKILWAENKSWVKLPGPTSELRLGKRLAE
jgi:hypothetical protein